MLNEHFDHDLRRGKIGEEWCIYYGKEHLLMEVKTEHRWWHITGNLFFEFSYKGRPSGLKVTKSEYWTVPLDKDGRKIGVIGFETERLKRNLFRLFAEGRIDIFSCGDNLDSIGYLFPMRLMEELFK